MTLSFVIQLRRFCCCFSDHHHKQAVLNTAALAFICREANSLPNTDIMASSSYIRLSFAALVVALALTAQGNVPQVEFLIRQLTGNFVRNLLCLFMSRLLSCIWEAIAREKLGCTLFTMPNHLPQALYVCVWHTFHPHCTAWQGRATIGTLEIYCASECC